MSPLQGYDSKIIIEKSNLESTLKGWYYYRKQVLMQLNPEGVTLFYNKAAIFWTLTVY